MSKKLSALFAFPLTLAIVLTSMPKLLIQQVQAAPGRNVASPAIPPSPPPVTSVDLSIYTRVGRFDLPEPTRTAAPPNSLLAQEASSVTYNWDTDTLFVVGDGGTSVVQVTKTGQLVNSMTLAPGSSPQGTDFYDTEGITYVGSGKFVLMEERYRQANLFTYVAGGTLHRADVQTVKLGTTIGNVGLEGISYDPLSGGFICVKEKDPESIFQTGIDFVAGTATNGSASATGSTNLFNPALANLADFSDVFALSNLPSLNGQPDYSHLLVISQESGQIINVDRSGNVSSSLTIVADPGNPLSVADQTNEGLTMDRDGNLYIVNENGGGDSAHPQLWVYAPSTAQDQAPIAVTLTNTVTSIPENTSTAAPVKVADIIVTDDGLGANHLTVTGADAGFFQIIGTALYLRTGTTLNATTKPSYNVTVNVDDPAVGSTPDAFANFTLTVTAAAGGTATLVITEVAPWSSGSGGPASGPASLRVDWFEVTNTGNATANITGWKIDDDSHTFGSAVALNGITNIAPGESVIFMETADLAGKSAAFKTLWFGANPPANLQIGNYSGSGVGLGTGGDEVNLYDSTGALKAKVLFGNSPSGPSFPTFDNAAGQNNATISTFSAVGVNGAFAAASDGNEIGSPGTIGAPATPLVNITATDANAAETGNDPGTFRISRTGSTVGPLTASYTIATGAGQATSADYTPTLTGAVTIPSGQSFIDITITPVDDGIAEGNETVTLTLGDSGSYDVGANATATVTIADGKVTPAITWANPADITYGTALSGTQLIATANVPGTFTYTPAAGTVLSSGTHTLHVDFVPADTINYNNASKDVAINVLSAVLTTTMTTDRNPALVGYNHNYKIVITNSGTAAATNMVVTDPLPAQVSFTAVSASQGSCAYNSGTRTVTCNLGTLGTGATANVQITVKPQQEGTLNNTATVTAGQWDSVTGNSSASVNGLPAVEQVDVSISMTDSVNPITVGEQVTYTLKIKNGSGPTSATNVVAMDSLPASMTFVSATTTQGNLVLPPVGSTGIVTANLGTLAPNATATVTITVTSTQAGSIVNTATVTQNEDDSTPANNTSSQTTTVKAPPPPVTLQKVLVGTQTLTGGCGNTTGNVYLTAPAPAGGVTVNLSSNISGASVPATVTIAAGQLVSPAFAVTSSPVNAKQTGLITATLGAQSVSRSITINKGNGTCQ